MELGRAAFARYRDAGPVAARDAAEVAAWLARQKRPETETPTAAGVTVGAASRSRPNTK